MSPRERKRAYKIADEKVKRAEREAQECEETRNRETSVLTTARTNASLMKTWRAIAHIYQQLLIPPSGPTPEMPTHCLGPKPLRDSEANTRSGPIWADEWAVTVQDSPFFPSDWMQIVDDAINAEIKLSFPRISWIEGLSSLRAFSKGFHFMREVFARLQPPSIPARISFEAAGYQLFVTKEESRRRLTTLWLTACLSSFEHLPTFTSSNNISVLESRPHTSKFDPGSQSIVGSKHDRSSRWRGGLGQVMKKVKRVKRGLASLVNGSRLSVIADTGAGQNMMSALYAKQRKLSVDSSSTGKFKIGNSSIITSIGTVTIDYAFAEEPSRLFKLTCHVIRDCLYDLILGSPFLTHTQTMSEYRRRLTECVFSISNFFHIGYLGNSSQLLRGAIADDSPAFAVPDTGAERNVMNLNYASGLGLHIDDRESCRGYLRFADGRFERTAGQVNTFWQFDSGKRIPITFDVLPNCCSDLIIGDDVLWDHNVFEAHASSLIDVFNPDEYCPLAPFGYETGWQKLTNKFRTKRKDNTLTEADVLFLSQDQEEKRRREWHHRYGFDGARADAEEKAAERARRERFIAESQQKAIPLIPSIPSAPNPPAALDKGEHRRMKPNINPQKHEPKNDDRFIERQSF
ncbi:uncharacterized protein KY384_001670 [Bacidia gigantensis]|uniref:uncharacterized protein n=1 Tax=Bacidia gigantensis TaxID=2732470 RepID=UPI001D03FFD2|nr:uncharacterized protein KY384_001670 [Bacidia gigantensis]KAG8533929.1 hypothetical protein KY384_001670 [Bacidia gigantensis]